MRIGYRVVKQEEVGKWDGELVQISLYRGREGNLARLRECVRACTRQGMPYVVHPVGYRLFDPGAFRELRHIAEESAGEALILHDERSPGGGRLAGEYEERFRAALEELRAHVPVSLENSEDTADVLWFWDRYGGSVTLDMGHMESSGLDSVEFVRKLDDHVVERVDYVHMHRNGALRGGLTDHWPLSPGCRELGALRELLMRKRDVGVILEINEREFTHESLGLLRKLRDGLSRNP